jgi:hypothetical protein
VHAKADASQAPGDEQVAAQMRQLAEMFIDGSAAEGQILGWEASSALRLDDLCQMFLASSPVTASRAPEPAGRHG